jgi:hypothetical protein
VIGASDGRDWETIAGRSIRGRPRGECRWSSGLHAALIRAVNDLCMIHCIFLSSQWSPLSGRSAGQLDAAFSLLNSSSSLAVGMQRCVNPNTASKPNTSDDLVDSGSYSSYS